MKLEAFDPKIFVEAEVEKIRKSIGNEKALVAVPAVLTAQHAPC